MGTDIHAFVEYSDDQSRCGFTGDHSTPAWLFGRFSLSRDYTLFDVLGDGRSVQFDSAEVSRNALFPPRGIPNDISHPVAREYFDLITDTEHPHPTFWPTHGCVTDDEANRRVAAGASQFGTIVQTVQFGSGPRPRSWRLVSKPHWHTPSWLTTGEIREAFKHFDLTFDDVGFDFRALFRTLESLENDLTPESVRLVFWFDN